jgi:hypothetical protein
VLHDGALQYIGDPEDAAMRYYRLNFAGAVAEDPGALAAPGDYPVSLELNARLISAQLLDGAGQPIENLEQGEPIILDALVQSARELSEPVFSFHVLNADGVVVAGFLRKLDERISSGQHVRLRGEIENRLVPGSYSLDCWIGRDGQAGDIALQPLRLIHFVVYGTAPRHGIVSLRSDVEASSELPPGQ